MYLNNAWYPAGWGHEVGAEFLTRTFLDIPIVLFRDDDGAIIAFHDQCPHRFAPLSMGSLVEGRLRCGYHGLEFDMTGQCVGSCLNFPAPKAARVRKFPIAEVDNVVWIWMGDDPPSPTDTLLRFPFHAGEPIVSYGHTLANSDYRLLSDNLMDLSHIHLLHPGFGGIDFPSVTKSWEEGDAVVTHYMSDYPEAPSIEENTLTWTAPSNHYLESSSTPRGGEMHCVPSAHLLTPETATSTHYFWSSGAPLGLSEPDNRAFLEQVFDHEDKPMVEAVQKRMAGREFWAMRPLLLPTDSGAVRARRKLEAMINQEAH